MHTILVTGSAGFIGHHLMITLGSQGHKVVGIDNLNDYYSVSLKYGRLREQGFNKSETSTTHITKSQLYSNLYFQVLDLTDSTALQGLFEAQSFDYVINLAAQAGVRYSITSPESYIQSNLVGFANLLEACRNFPVLHLVYASSSSVYGLNSKVPFSTEDFSDFPISLYAATKKSNEVLAHSYSHLYEIPTTGLRFFTVYGAWGRPDMAYFSFTKAILENRPIEVFNHGKLSRDFTYIDDIVEGIDRVLKTVPQKNDSKSTRAPYRLYNIGNNRPVNLLEFIECIESELGKKAKKVMVDMQLGDTKITYADVTQLIEDTGYAPKTELQHGITKFVQWYKQYYKI